MKSIARLVYVLTVILIASQNGLVGQDMSEAGAPSWVTAGVPDSVWILVGASTADGPRAKELLEEAESHARTAVEGDDQDVGRRFALAVVLGLHANREGGRTKVRAASELHRELVTILEMDPDHALARHLMGRLHAGVLRMGRVTRWIATNLLGGGELKQATWEEAERNLAFAEEHAPEVADHHLQLANVFRDTDRPERALEEVEHVLALRASSPLEEGVRAEALQLQEKLHEELGLSRGLQA